MVSGASLVLLAVGAILTFATSIQVRGIDLNTVGVILMIVGGIGALMSMVFWNGPLSRSRRTVVREDPVTGRQTVVEDDRYSAV